MTDQPVHWIRGGSGSDRIVACPGSVNIQQQYPAEPSGPAAVDGTHSHSLLEKCLRTANYDADLLVSSTIEDHEGSFVVDEARAKRVNVALAYIKARIEDLQEQGFNPQLYIEEFVDAGQPYGVPHWGGSADWILIWETGIETGDYKDGGKLVSPESYQPITYTIGAMNRFYERKFENIRVVIIQPKRSDKPQIKDYTLESFQGKARTIVDAMRTSMRKDAPLAAGDHCTWCRGAKPGRCPEHNRRATIAMNDALKGVPVPGVGGGIVSGNAAPLQIPEINGEMSEEVLAQIIDAKPIILGLLAEAEKEGLRRAVAGTKIPNHKVVRGITHKKWAPDAMDTLGKMRLKKNVYMVEKPATPAAVLSSDAVKAMSERSRKKIEELIIKPEGALKLVPESDPGKEVTFGVSQDAIERATTTEVPVPQIEEPKPAAVETPVAKIKVTF